MNLFLGNIQILGPSLEFFFTFNSVSKFKQNVKFKRHLRKHVQTQNLKVGQTHSIEMYV